MAISELKTTAADAMAAARRRTRKGPCAYMAVHVANPARKAITMSISHLPLGRKANANVAASTDSKGANPSQNQLG